MRGNGEREKMDNRSEQMRERQGVREYGRRGRKEEGAQAGTVVFLSPSRVSQSNASPPPACVVL